MNFINFIVWLAAGAVIGWFASRMVDIEHKKIHIFKFEDDHRLEKI